VEQWEEKQDMKTTFLKKKENSIQNSVRNEENRYPVPDLKTMITSLRNPVTPT
jgi:hypothetical protein